MHANKPNSGECKTKPAAIFCSFTALDELAGKKMTVSNVLHVLSKTGCFSVFDVTDANAKMFDEIYRRGLVQRVGDSGYPWVDVVVTDAGRKVMECAK